MATPNDEQKKLNEEEELPTLENGQVEKTVQLNDEEMKGLLNKRKDSGVELDDDDEFQDAKNGEEIVEEKTEEIKKDEAEIDDLDDDEEFYDILNTEEKQPIENKKEEPEEPEEIIEVMIKDIKKEREEKLKEINDEYDLKLKDMTDAKIQMLYLTLKASKKKEEDIAFKKACKDLETEIQRKIRSKRTDELLEEYTVLKEQRKLVREEMMELIKNKEELEEFLREGLREEISKAQKQHDNKLVDELIEDGKRKRENLKLYDEKIKQKENEMIEKKMMLENLKKEITRNTVDDIAGSDNLYVYENRNGYICFKDLEDMKLDNMEYYYEKLDKVKKYMKEHNIDIPKSKSRFRRMLQGFIRKNIIAKQTRENWKKGFFEIVDGIRDFFKRIFSRKRKIKDPNIEKEINKVIKILNKGNKEINKKDLIDQQVELLKLKNMYKIFSNEVNKYENKKEIMQMMSKYARFRIGQINKNVGRILKKESVIDYSKKPKYVIKNPNKIEDIENSDSIRSKREKRIPTRNIQEISQQIQYIPKQPQEKNGRDM